MSSKTTANNKTTTNVETTKKAIGTFSKVVRVHILEGQPYHNCIRMIKAFPYADFEYVEGYILLPDGTKVLHAWLINEEKQFDPTCEIFHPEWLGLPREILIRGTAWQLRSEGYIFTADWMPLAEQIM